MKTPLSLKKKRGGGGAKEKTECVVLYEVQKTLIKYEGTSPNQIQHNRPIHSWETTKHDLFLSRRQPPKDSLEALLTGKLPKLWWRKKPLFRHEKWVLSFPWNSACAQDTQFTVYSLSVLINNQTDNLPWTHYVCMVETPRTSGSWPFTVASFYLLSDDWSVTIGSLHSLVDDWSVTIGYFKPFLMIGQ